MSVLALGAFFELLLLWDKLLRVSAASISSIDMPESTLPALVDRSSDLIMSMSMEAGLCESAEERWAERGGEKGGGKA